MPTYTQANRPLRVDTELGEDVLLLSAVEGLEGTSQLFSFHLELLAEQPDLDPAAILRTPVLVSLRLPDGEHRLIHGVVRRFGQMGMRDDLVYYRAEVVPWLWFLTLSRESRIYQELAVTDILEQVFQRTGLSDYELRLTRSYPERLYCVQYRETHLDFVLRLMEEEGIYYFFEHSEDKHLLVLTDANGSSEPVPHAETLRYSPHGRQEESVVTEWEHEHSVRSGKVTLWDYHFETPNVKLEATLGEENLEIYDYPGTYKVLSEGERQARLLLEAVEADRQTLRGVSDAAALTPGYHFSLKEHYRSDANAKYLITQVHHLAHTGDYRGWDESAALTYRNEFRCIPHETPYRPPRRTPKPVVHGTQTAVVVGPAGEEVYVDKYGRIKVQFHWDRDGKRDENSSCWIRIAMPWAGKGYGSISIPRIGNEVVVAFEEGNPDYPLVVGSVYNADQTVPFELPASGIQQGMKSRSSKGGGGNNEISMTDTKGKEMVNVHAQFDMTTTVEHDQTDTINNNRTTSVAVDDTESVGSNQAISVGADQSLSVGGNQTADVGGNQDVTVGGNVTTSIGGNEERSVGGNESVSVGGDESVSVGGSRSVSVSSNDEVTAGANMKHGANANVELSSGAAMKIVAGSTGEISANATLDVSAGATMKLSAGGSTIEIGPAGITIQTAGIVTVQGATIKLN